MHTEAPFGWPLGTLARSSLRAKWPGDSGKESEEVTRHCHPRSPAMAPCAGVQDISVHPGASSLPEVELRGGTMKTCLPQDGHRARHAWVQRRHLCPVFRSGLFRASSWGTTQRPIQDGPSSESKQMSRGAQQGPGTGPAGPASGVGVEGSHQRPRCNLCVPSDSCL